MVEMDEEEYKKGMEERKYNIVGRFFLQKGNAPPTTMELKERLGIIWGLKSFKLVPMGGGNYHVVLHLMEDQSAVMAQGSVNLSLGTFRVTRWLLGFDLTCLKTTTNIWIGLFGMPLEFRKEQNLLNISIVVGLPIKIDLATINMYQGLYTRVLVDVDVSRILLERILASLKNEKMNINVSISF